MSELLVPVSYGELLDKIAILQIKSERMTDSAKLENVRRELSALEGIWMTHPAAGGDVVSLRAQLKAVNERLWVIEDDIRLGLREELGQVSAHLRQRRQTLDVVRPGRCGDELELRAGSDDLQGLPADRPGRPEERDPLHVAHFTTGPGRRW
jgi:hypothetical protein